MKVSTELLKDVHKHVSTKFDIPKVVVNDNDYHFKVSMQFKN